MGCKQPLTRACDLHVGLSAAAEAWQPGGVHSAAAPVQMPGRATEDRLPYRRSSSATGHPERLQAELGLVKIAARYGIEVHYQHNLVAVDGPLKTATFEKVSEQNKGERITVPFDMLHVSPPRKPARRDQVEPARKRGGLGRSQPEFNATRALPQRILARRC